MHAMVIWWVVILEYVVLSNVGLKGQSPCLLRCLFAEYATVMYHGT